jgi:hypothetical protein
VDCHDSQLGLRRLPSHVVTPLERSEAVEPRVVLLLHDIGDVVKHGAGLEDDAGIARLEAVGPHGFDVGERPIQLRAVQRRTGEVRAPQAGALQTGVLEAAVLELGEGELGAAKVGALQASALQVRPEGRVPAVGMIQAGVAKIAHMDAGSAQRPADQ